MHSTNRKSAQAKAKSAERKTKQQARGSNVFRNKSPSQWRPYLQ